MVSFVPDHLFNLSFTSSYGANIPKFNTIALTIVGPQPVHKAGTPSSFAILLKALKTLV